MRKAFLIIALLALVLSLFAGCQAPRDPNVLYDDPPSNMLKIEISTAYTEKYGSEFDWDCAKPDIGTINGCTVIVVRGWSADMPMYRLIIADHEFWYSGPLSLFAYRNGEICHLQEAYENGWLTKEQIGLLHAKYEKIQENWGVYYEEWLTQKEEYEDSSDVNLIYKRTLTDEEKENIRALVLEKYDEIVRWGYVDPYYGTINDYSVVIAHPRKSFEDEVWRQEIAGCTFEWDSPIGLYVYYHDKYNLSFVYTLQAAYEKGLLTEKQIGAIHERHEQYRLEFPYMLEQWSKAQREAQDNET